MQPIDILIAEDNPKDFEFLKQLLNEWEEPVNITRAPNGSTALEIGLLRNDPLVISDIQMPEMNGIDFARNLWEQQPLQESFSGANSKMKCMFAPWSKSCRLRLITAIF
jgi:CheY-like chemotaxis protein